MFVALTHEEFPWWELKKTPQNSSPVRIRLNLRSSSYRLNSWLSSLFVRDCLWRTEGTRVRGELGWPAERRGGLPQVQAGHRGRSGQELPHQLPRHGSDPRQDVLHGQEVAGNVRFGAGSGFVVKPWWAFQMMFGSAVILGFYLLIYLIN